MALFRPYERKTEHPGREPRQRTRLVPGPKKKAGAATDPGGDAAGSAVQEAREPEAPKPAAGKVKVVRRKPVRKSEPTPTRKQAEAARMERLHPNLTPKEQRKADREASARQRMESWDKIESSPERVLARDYVDARWTVTEFMFPVMILINGRDDGHSRMAADQPGHRPRVVADAHLEPHQHLVHVAGLPEAPGPPRPGRQPARPADVHVQPGNVDPPFPAPSAPDQPRGDDMSYQWRPDAGAHEMEDLRSQDLLPEFGTQQEAEDWLGLYWSDLLEAGVTQVSLWDADQQVLPAMSLNP